MVTAGSNQSQPELPGIPEAPGKIWRTLFGRTILEFESCLLGDNKGQILNAQYVRELVEQKNISMGKVRKITVFTIIFSFIFVIILSGYKVNINLFGFEVAKFPAIIESSTFIISLMFLSGILLWTDYVILDRMINIVFSKYLTWESNKFFYANIDGEGFLNDLISPKIYGYKSGKVHWILYSIIAIFFILLAFGAIFSPAALAIYAFIQYFTEFFNGVDFFFWVVMFSIMMVSIGIILFLFVYIIPLRYHIEAGVN